MVLGLLATALVVAPIILSAGTASADVTPWTATQIDESSNVAFDYNGYLQSVSCLTGTTCVAAGLDNENTSEPLQITGDAQTWGGAEVAGIDFSSVGKGDAGIAGGQINGISCVTTSLCVAVGNTSTGDQPFVLIGNPATWTVAQATLLPPQTDSGRGTLSAVTCTGTDTLWCVAVGTDQQRGEAMWLYGNPSTWTSSDYQLLPISPSDSENNFTEGSLDAVSCTSETFCVAVGQVLVESRAATLRHSSTASEVQGTSLLTVVGDPNPNDDSPTWSPDNAYTMSTSSGNLAGVSCTSESFCVAVGGDEDGNPIYLTGDPTGWSDPALYNVLQDPALYNVLQLGENFGGYEYSGGGELSAVDCTSQTWCVGVGQDNDYQPLAVMGDPTTWDATDAQEISLTTPATEAYLASVSCTAQDVCVTVGSFDSRDYQDELRHTSATSRTALAATAGPFTAWISPAATPPTYSAPAPVLYPVTYLPGGGTGTPPTQASLNAGATFTVASASSLTYTGETFTGWSDGTTVYQPGATYTMPAAPVTLTAQWTPLPTSPSSVTKPLLRTEVLFPFNKYYLTAQAKKQLDAFAKKIKQATVTSFTVVGSTDLFGSEGYNIPLSEHRAHAVSAYLTAQLSLLGVNDVVFHDTWIGILKTQPTYTQNRRTVVAD
jgi:outer membrane protein OmpA-like peptidoglycan-associated protein